MSDLLALPLACAAALLLRRYVLCLTRIQGRSMLPTLKSGQWAFVTRFDYRLHPPRRGDVVICFFPGRMMKRLPFLRQMMVKRVVGLPGETVAFAEGRVLIGGLPLDEPYLDPLHTRRPITREAVTLGENEYFVLGDNRDGSRDSRAVGPLDRRMIVGRVRFLLPFHPVGAGK